MSEPFARPNTPALTKIVDGTLTGAYGGYEEMKTALRNSLGMPAPATEVASLPPAGQPQELSLPVEVHRDGNCMRVIYPGGNARFEIYSDSEEGLDLQEARLRALYQ